MRKVMPRPLSGLPNGHSTLHDAFDGDPKIQVISALPNWITLRLSADLTVLDRVVAYFRSHMARLPRELCENLSLALHELLENAVEHGCGFDPLKHVDLTYVRAERMLMFEVRDPGVGFSLGSLDHTALTNPPDQPLQHVEYRCSKGMRPGGYGILMAKRVADELIYNECGNEVKLVKYL